MDIKSPILLIEINDNKFKFIVGEIDNEENFKLIFKNAFLFEGISDNKIINFDLVFNSIKSTIHNIEQKLKKVFGEAILVLDDCNTSLINFSGYKRLNGSQLTKENITYILNSLKSKVNEIEKEKKILHIFNSKYLLDGKKIDNLPIGLFGNFYSQELSFFLIDNNYIKNLYNIFNNCNLKIKKIISKNYLLGTNLINQNINLETFLIIKFEMQTCKIIFFENSAPKFIQEFNFGSDIILKDISKVTGLNINNVKNILLNTKLISEDSKNEFIEETFFYNQNYRKIKKKLILDIASARIEEILELMINKNVNLLNLLPNNLKIFISLSDLAQFECLKEKFQYIFSNKNSFKTYFHENMESQKLFENALKLVQYGWKKEAVPVVHEKKSIIARFFNFLFS